MKEGRITIKRKMINGRQWVVTEQDTQIIVRGIGFLFRAGEKANGMSIPKWIKPLTVLSQPKYDVAGFLHDKIYATGGDIQGLTFTRKASDVLFRHHLRQIGAPFVDRWLAYFYVRLFGKHGWRTK